MKKESTKKIENMIIASRKRFVSLTGGVVSACLKTANPMQSLKSRYQREIRDIFDMFELSETKTADKLIYAHMSDVNDRFLEAYHYFEGVENK